MFRLDEICHIFAIWKILQYFSFWVTFFSFIEGKIKHSSSKWIYDIYSKKRVKEFTNIIKYKHFISKDEIIIQQTTTWSQFTLSFTHFLLLYLLTFYTSTDSSADSYSLVLKLFILWCWLHHVRIQTARKVYLLW